MKTIVLANNKGGVGKTTSALNIAYALNARGHTVLLVDGDQQGNLSQSFTYNAPASRTLAAVLLGRTSLADAVEEVDPAGHPGLFVLPAGVDLNDAIAKRAERPGAELVLRKLTQGAEVDFVIYDTPGSMGKLTDAALTAADAVFIPVRPEVYGIKGVVELVLRAGEIQDGLNPGLKVGGLFFTQHHRSGERRRLIRDTVDAMEGHAVLGPLVMRTSIRDNVRVKEAQEQKADLLTYAPESTAAVDYITLTAELLTRLHDA